MGRETPVGARTRRKGPAGTVPPGRYGVSKVSASSDPRDLRGFRAWPRRRVRCQLDVATGAVGTIWIEPVEGEVDAWIQSLTSSIEPLMERSSQLDGALRVLRKRPDKSRKAIR